MVSRLLPDGSQAGIWTFGRQVNMLVPHGRVDDGWRRKAVDQSMKINSVGLYTNIGQALQVASDDFYRSRQFDRTHFILLTDGMVDVPGGRSADEAERKRILGKVLSRIKAHGAHIDTIALSPQADQGLLKRLAVATGGTFTVATTADELSRAFLEAFDNASPTEQVPITDNRFKVDSSIREFTALVFHKPGGQPMRLIGPDGKSFGAKADNKNVHWLHQQAYDMVTVDKPQAGTWHIDAELKPGSRVTVVSNLRMAVSQLPANFYPEDRMDLAVAFYDQKSQVTNKDFLGLIKVNVTVSDQSGRSGTKTLSKPGHVPDDGVYHAPIAHLSRPGTYHVKVTADGKTFQREQTQTVTLRAPVDVQVHGQGSGQQSRYLVTVTPQDPGLDPQDTTVALRYQAPDGNASIQDLKFNTDLGAWQAKLTATQGVGIYQAELRVIDGVAGSKGGRVLFAPDAFKAQFPRPAGAGTGYVDLRATSRPAPSTTPATSSVTSSPVEAQPVPHPAPAARAPVTPEKTSTPKTEPAPLGSNGNDRWLLWIGGSIGTLVALAGAFWFWRRRRSKAAAQPQAEAVAESEHEPEEAEPEDGQEAEQASEPEPALEPMDEDEPEAEAMAAVTSEEPIPEAEEEPDIADVDEALADAPTDGSSPEEIPVMEESVPEPEEAQPDEQQTSKTVAGDLDAEALADQILEENNQGSEDDDFGLEDFDIGDVEGLQREAPQNGGETWESAQGPDDDEPNNRKS